MQPIPIIPTPDLNIYMQASNRSITHPPAFTAHMHTQVKGGHNRDINTLPLKIGAMRYSP